MKFGFQITGRKAPPLKHLAEWLRKNPEYDVESKWGHLVRAKVCFDHDVSFHSIKAASIYSFTTEFCSLLYLFELVAN